MLQDQHQDRRISVSDGQSRDQDRGLEDYKTAQLHRRAADLSVMQPAAGWSNVTPSHLTVGACSSDQTAAVARARPHSVRPNGAATRSGQRPRTGTCSPPAQRHPATAYNNNNNNNNTNVFFIRRSTRDLVSVPVPLNAYTALQLCFDHGLLLFR